jgi:hypothetical protein
MLEIVPGAGDAMVSKAASVFPLFLLQIFEYYLHLILTSVINNSSVDLSPHCFFVLFCFVGNTGV